MLCRRDTARRITHVETIDDLSLKTRQRQLVKSSREAEIGHYVYANALKAEIEIAWVRSNQRQRDVEEDTY